ncbi:MAG TPA: alpha-glucosidase [Nitrosospira sp.]|nr:alpha-glucosidase [Nitrosospira sp.]
MPSRSPKSASNESDREWWKKTTVYHIYLRSFLDTNNDGIGDIGGVIEKLDYLQELGYETIWVSPFTQSPQRDFGYDISDYFSIAHTYGDMAIFEELLREMHSRNMKLVFDLVLNHTSDEHPWFKESASSRDNPKADWYIWRDGKGRSGMTPPNNWRAMAGNKAWTYHPGRKQFYYTAFLPFQPDLNYHNPEVKQAMFDVVRFWLSKGVDGFRLDIISAIYEDPDLTPNPASLRLTPSDGSLSVFFQHLKNNFLHEKSFEFATELRSVVDEFDNPKRVLIGESHGDESVISRFCRTNEKDGLHAVFLFKAISTPFRAENYRKMLMTFEEHFPEPLTPTLVFANHDRTRIISRLGGSVAKAKLLALFQFTCRGIPFTYFGDEIGIPRVRIPLRQGKDAIAIQHKWVPQPLADRSVEILNRDECRTPMLWNSEPNAGFCHHSMKPWLPLADNFQEINVEKQTANPHSLLNLYKKLIRLRNETPALHEGSLEIANELCDKNVLAYCRISGTQKYMVMLNMSKYRVKNSLNGEMALSTHPESETSQLQPFEGRVMKPGNF